MAIALGALMLAGVIRIVMAAGRASRNRLVVGGIRLTGAVLVDVKAVRPRRQTLQSGLYRGAARPVGDRHCAERVAGAGLRRLLYVRAQLRRQRRSGSEQQTRYRYGTRLPSSHRVLLGISTNGSSRPTRQQSSVTFRRNNAPATGVECVGCATSRMG